MELGVLIALGAVAAVVATMLLRRARGDMSREQHDRASGLQAFLAARVEDLRQILAKEDLSVEAKRAEAYAILAQMQSRNTAGNLDAFIQDNREAIDAELDEVSRSD